MSAPSTDVQDSPDTAPERPDADKAPKKSPGKTPEKAPEKPVPCAAYPLTTRIEALLMSTDRPLAEGRLVELLGLSGKKATAAVTEAVEALEAQFTKQKRAVEIVRSAGGWQIMTRPDFGDLLGRLHRDRQQTRLSQAALETLAIVAYRQPMIRAEVEAIRGVACGEVLRGLMERRLVKIVGRAEELGRPMLYGTTKQFLEIFGLAGADDLPVIEGLETRRAEEAKARRAARRAAEAAQAKAAAAEAEAEADAEAAPAADAGATPAGEAPADGPDADATSSDTTPT